MAVADVSEDKVGLRRNEADLQAAKFTLDYDARWGATSGPWTTDMFIEAVYKDLAKANEAPKPAAAKAPAAPAKKK